MPAVILGLLVAGLGGAAAMAEDAGGRDAGLPAWSAGTARSAPAAALPPPALSRATPAVTSVAKSRTLRNPLPGEDDEDDAAQLDLPAIPGSHSTLRLGSRDGDPVTGAASRRVTGVKPLVAAGDRDAVTARHLRAGVGHGVDKDLRFGLSFDIP